MERQLSDDVHRVGDTLGRVLRAHQGEALFEVIEAMRKAAKDAREASGDEARENARAELDRICAELSPAMALEAARAFTLYFQLVNIAEDVHRARVLRSRLRQGGPAAVAESFHVVLRELGEKGLSRDELMKSLGEFHLRFVFTSHPTEARRRTTERLLATVRECLESVDREILTPIEEEILERRLQASIEALWEHAAERRARPEVLEEVKAGLWYLRNVLLDVMPRMQRRLHRAFEAHFGNIDPLEIPAMVSFGSWMGADRDGNPYVTDAVMERTLELHRWIVLERYLVDLDGLVDPLSAAAHRLPSLPRLDEALRRAEAAVPEVVREFESRNPDEPLRRLLSLMRERIVRTRSNASGAYAHAEAFLSDLRVLREALLAMKAHALANDALLDLIHRVRCFGFHLATLDVREDSRVHGKVLDELISADYRKGSQEERKAALASLRLPPPQATLSEEARRLLDLFATIQRLQARFGAEAIGTYIVSMTESASDILEVLRLASLQGIDRSLDIVPLFETLEALSASTEVLSTLYADADYRAHLDARARCQEVLVGYSDSMKEVGIVASRMAIHTALRRNIELSEKEGIALRFFHGRGGSVSRGGGPTYRAIRALPSATIRGCMKITEQGETRAFHFASPELAVRYLEQSLGAALGARHQQAPETLSQELLSSLASESRRAYRALVEDPGLIPYFQEATPIEHIAALQIASRPSRRSLGAMSLEALRAIPWVFAWSQSRQLVTGWFGVGHALSHWAAGDEATSTLLDEAYRNSRFFRDLIDNVQMSLAKADLPIATRYAELCQDAAIRERIFGEIRAEFERTRSWVLRLIGNRELLEDDPVLQRSIRLRNPYVDPLSYLQVTAMRHLRQGQDAKKESAWREVARVTVQGIAAGLRNTG